MISSGKKVQPVFVMLHWQTMGERRNGVAHISQWLVSFYSDPKYLRRERGSRLADNVILQQLLQIRSQSSLH